MRSYWTLMTEQTPANNRVLFILTFGTQHGDFMESRLGRRQYYEDGSYQTISNL